MVDRVYLIYPNGREKLQRDERNTPHVNGEQTLAVTASDSDHLRQATAWNTHLRSTGMSEGEEEFATVLTDPKIRRYV